MKTGNRTPVIMMVMILPFLLGCLGSGGYNPVADNSLPSGDSPAGVLTTVRSPDAQIRPAQFTQPTKREYTFARPDCRTEHRIKQGVNLQRGVCRLSLHGNSQTDNIFITIENVKVKPKHGKPITFSLSAQEIDLKKATALSEILGEMELPSGDYNYFEFSVKTARVVVDGESRNLTIPSKKVRFLGKFSIKDGYRTELAIKFSHRLLVWKGFFKKNFDILHPVVRITSELVPLAAPAEVTSGDVSGTVVDFVNGLPLAGVSIALEGTVFSATTGTDGTFAFTEVPAGDYAFKATHPDYLDNSTNLQVLAGQESAMTVELNPAVIKSTVANTGWFSQIYPMADAHGTYGETSMETPVAIDFASLAFVKAELTFTAEFHNSGASRFNAYLSASQQVDAETSLGTWWAGNNAVLGTLLGEFYATNPGTTYTLDMTDFVRNNPNSAYFFAARNLHIIDIRVQGIQLCIYYR